MIHPQTIAAARLLMGTGSSMKDAAIQLGVRSQDLDLGLWQNLGIPTRDLIPVRERRVTYLPDFD